ncbi:Erythronate-4-phosphate dehydrogenase, partial [hydrothermal vent metagenome]
RSINKTVLKDAQILLVRSVTQVDHNLLHDTAIKFVASATSGINHIDLTCLKNQGITFAYAAGSNANSVAQYVVAGICYWSLQQQKPLDQLTIGIVGYGNVGKKVQQLCSKLHIKSIINDPPLAAKTTSKHQRDFHSLKDTLACDIISLHVPLVLTGQYATKYLINTPQIQQLQSDTLFINTSRGEVVNEAALLSRKLDYNDISIILDVWNNEPDINLQMLAQTLIATPHIAGYSLDGKISGTQMIYQACCQFLNVKARWSASNMDCSITQPYDCNQTKQQDIRLAILAAYNIASDSTQLKKLLTSPTVATSKYFDDLRKHYPTRREWEILG